MIELLKKLRRNPSKVIDYLLGNYRIFMFKHIPFLLRHHIKDQFLWRVSVMSETCLNNRECIICGCKTPNLQFTSKACEGSCYPNLMSKKLWTKIQNRERYGF